MFETTGVNFRFYQKYFSKFRTKHVISFTMTWLRTTIFNFVNLKTYQSINYTPLFIEGSPLKAVRHWPERVADLHLVSRRRRKRRLGEWSLILRLHLFEHCYLNRIAFLSSINQSTIPWTQTLNHPLKTRCCARQFNGIQPGRKWIF